MMKHNLSWLIIMAMTFAPTLFAADITIPLEDGSLVLKDIRFLAPIGFGDTPFYSPGLAFTLVNQTKQAWMKLDLRLTIAGTCASGPVQWTRDITTSVGYMNYIAATTKYSERFEDLSEKVAGCTASAFQAKLISAENFDWRISGVTGMRTDLAAEKAAAERLDEKVRAARIKLEEEVKKKAAEAEAKRRERDITIPLEDGTLVLQDISFIETNQIGDTAFTYPQLSFTLVNQTKQAWMKLDLRVTIDGTCASGPVQWTRDITTSVDYTKYAIYVATTKYSERFEDLKGKVDGCKATAYQAKLISAENSEWRINSVTGVRIDKAAERAAEAKRAEQARKKAEEAESKRRQENCALIYANTVKKKVSDLTVGESQAIVACQLLGLYQPAE